MGARLLILLGVLLLLIGCTTRYRNSVNPSYGQVEFDRDWYECRRENTHPRATKFGAWADATMEVDYDGARACLAARGWRPASPDLLRSAPSQESTSSAPNKRTAPACESGMYWDSSSERCLKIGQ